MTQGLRDLLANRKFAIPLIVLLTFCFVGLILAGVVLLLRPNAGGEPIQVAGQALTPSVTAAELVTFTPTAVQSPTARPSPTLVPLATVAGGDQGTPAATAISTPAATAAQPTATTDSTNGDDELAQTGLGWGLILFAGGGLAGLAVAARRLRLS